MADVEEAQRAVNEAEAKAGLPKTAFPSPTCVESAQACLLVSQWSDIQDSCLHCCACLFCVSQGQSPAPVPSVRSTDIIYRTPLVIRFVLICAGRAAAARHPRRWR